MGRKSLAILSHSLLTIFLFLVGALTKSKCSPPMTDQPGAGHKTHSHLIYDSLRQLHLQPRNLRDRGHALPFPRVVQHRLDAAALPLSAGGHELQHPRDGDGRVPVRGERHCVSLPFPHPSSRGH